MMPELFLQYIWLQRLFYPEGMTTADGERVEVVNPGKSNTDSGPDFFNAQIRIDDTLWAGNVEIHACGDDWFRHGHDKDAAYDNVILHVVECASSRPPLNSKGRVIPEVVMRFSPDIVSRYEDLMNEPKVVRCGKFLGNLSKFDRDSYLDRLLMERIEVKVNRVEQLFSLFEGDLDQVFYTLVCRSLGGRVNGQAMEQLATVAPLKLLLKHNDLTQMEALLLGQSGLLTPFINGSEQPDDYTSLLIREYNILKAKFSLTPMDPSIWKLYGLRPDNFPCLRLAEVAAFVARIPGNFESVFCSLDYSKSINTIGVKPSGYWDNHYILSRPSRFYRPKVIGKSSARVVVINAVVPTLLVHYKRIGDEKGFKNVVCMLSFVPPESNVRLRQFIEYGVKPHHENEVQALLHLYSEYCEPRKCLLCRWGHLLLSKRNTNDITTD